MRNLFVALFLVMICTSSLAAAPDLGLSTNMNPTNDSPNNITVGISSDYFSGYFTKIRNPNAALELKDMPLSTEVECSEDTTSIILHKDGDKIIWSLAPSLSRYSFNLLDDIKNFQVRLQCRF